jgi:hypothetical protein
MNHSSARSCWSDTVVAPVFEEYRRVITRIVLPLIAPAVRRRGRFRTSPAT